MVLLDSLVEQEALRRLPVSEHARSLLPAVVEFPLGNAADLALVSGRDHSNVYPRLWELHGAGLVGCESLGATRGRSIRWWVSQKGLDEAGLGGLAWQQPWALSQLLARLPCVEWLYQVAGSLTSMGGLQSFQWFTGVSWDAAVRYERGWAAFFWSGILQVEARLRGVLADLVEDLREYSVGPGPAWPGLLVFVVTDGWQRELVFRVARSFGVERMVQVCVDDGSVACMERVRRCEAAGGCTRPWQPV